jgi:hypothetical protein
MFLVCFYFFPPPLSLPLFLARKEDAFINKQIRSLVKEVTCNKINKIFLNHIPIKQKKRGEAH